MLSAVMLIPRREPTGLQKLGCDCCRSNTTLADQTSSSTPLAGTRRIFWLLPNSGYS